MENIVDVIKALPGLLPLHGATYKEIDQAEAALGLHFAEDYEQYLVTFGAIVADGIELTGIANSAHRNVVNCTKKAWELNQNVNRKCYVLEDTGVDGIVIWQHVSGRVYATRPGGVPEKIAGSLCEYIQMRTNG